MRHLIVLVALLMVLPAGACDQTQYPMEPQDSQGPVAGPATFAVLGPADAVNVAEGASVTLHGSFFTDGWGAGLTVAVSTVVDGVFLPKETQWDQGAVWWDVHDGQPRALTIDLGGTFRITEFIAQVDDNDAYVLGYYDSGWLVAWLVPNYGPQGWGMLTRPNVDDDTERYTLPTPIVTNALLVKLHLPSTDQYGSVSEIQAFGIRILDIDIKPGSFPNSINRKSNGVVPVAILGAENFDVRDVDVSTLEFGPDCATPAHHLDHAGTYATHLEDVNGDGYTDLVTHYRQKAAGFAGGELEACLTGETVDGIPFEGCDSVRIL